MFRFTIRELVLVTVIAALGVGWAIDCRRISAAHHRDSARWQALVHATSARLAEAEDLLEFEGVVFGDGQTIHTTPEHAATLRKERAAKTR